MHKTIVKSIWCNILVLLKYKTTFTLTKSHLGLGANVTEFKQGGEKIKASIFTLFDLIY